MPGKVYARLAPLFVLALVLLSPIGCVDASAQGDAVVYITNGYLYAFVSYDPEEFYQYWDEKFVENATGVWTFGFQDLERGMNISILYGGAIGEIGTSYLTIYLPDYNKLYVNVYKSSLISSTEDAGYQVEYLEPYLIAMSYGADYAYYEWELPEGIRVQEKLSIEGDSPSNSKLTIEVEAWSLTNEPVTVAVRILWDLSIASSDYVDFAIIYVDNGETVWLENETVINDLSRPMIWMATDDKDAPTLTVYGSLNWPTYETTWVDDAAGLDVAVYASWDALYYEAWIPQRILEGTLYSSDRDTALAFYSHPVAVDNQDYYTVLKETLYTFNPATGQAQPPPTTTTNPPVQYPAYTRTATAPTTPQTPPEQGTTGMPQAPFQQGQQQTRPPPQHHETSEEEGEEGGGGLLYIVIGVVIGATIVGVIAVILIMRR